MKNVKASDVISPSVLCRAIEQASLTGKFTHDIIDLAVTNLLEGNYIVEEGPYPNPGSINPQKRQKRQRPSPRLGPRLVPRLVPVVDKLSKSAAC